MKAPVSYTFVRSFPPILSSGCPILFHWAVRRCSLKNSILASYPGQKIGCVSERQDFTAEAGTWEQEAQACQSAGAGAGGGGHPLASRLEGEAFQ